MTKTIPSWQHGRFINGIKDLEYSLVNKIILLSLQFSTGRIVMTITTMLSPYTN